MGGVSGTLLEWTGVMWWCCRTVAQCSKLKQGFELSDPFAHSSITGSITFEQEFIHQPVLPPVQPQLDSCTVRQLCRESVLSVKLPRISGELCARIRGLSVYRPLLNIEQVECIISGTASSSVFRETCLLPTSAGFDLPCLLAPVVWAQLRYALAPIPARVSKLSVP